MICQCSSTGLKLKSWSFKTGTLIPMIHLSLTGRIDGGVSLKTKMISRVSVTFLALPLGPGSRFSVVLAAVEVPDHPTRTTKIQRPC